MKKVIRWIIDIIIVILILYLLYLIIPAYISHKNTKELQETNMKIVNQKYGELVCDNGYVYEDINHNIEDTEFTPNDVIGYVSMPQYDMKVPIVEGNSADNQYEAMDKGVSHDPLSGLPTDNYDSTDYEDETIVLAGHRNLSFQALKDAKPGDGVILNIDNNIYLFEVKDAHSFQPENSEEVFYLADQETLVMYTCYPFVVYGPITGRYGVYAERVEKLEC